jgi:hypothetical protein
LRLWESSEAIQVTRVRPEIAIAVSGRLMCQLAGRRELLLKIRKEIYSREKNHACLSICALYAPVSAASVCLGSASKDRITEHLAARRSERK